MKKTFYNIRNIDGQAIGTIDELKQDAQIKIWLQRCGLTMNDLNNCNNDKEYSLHTKYGDKLWIELLKYRIYQL